MFIRLIVQCILIGFKVVVVPETNIEKVKMIKIPLLL
jgi:hypothetical protein